MRTRDALTAARRVTVLADASPGVLSALDEIGIDASKKKPRTLGELEEWEGLNFDLIITLSPERAAG